MLFIAIHLLTTLGLATLKQEYLLKLKNSGYFIFHFGLWLFLVAEIIGSGDLKQGKMNLLKDNNLYDIAISAKGEISRLPFALKLVDFNMVSYNPRLTMRSDAPLEKTGENYAEGPLINKAVTYLIAGWYIEVRQYMAHSILKDSVFKVSDEQGNYSAAFLSAFNTRTHTLLYGWVSSGSFLQKPRTFRLTPVLHLELSEPQHKSYCAVVEIYRDSIPPETVTIEVNHPYHTNGWSISQIGYDQSKGNWSSLSILELVKDPWLPVLYTAGISMFAGIVILLWFRVKSA